jgi:triosephosphate isomerase (TIM)
MNLNHLEAIALTQKLAFSLPEKQLNEVEVVVLPPFVSLRSVQTLIDGDKLLLGYGAQDLSPHATGAYTGDVSGAMLAKLGCQYAVVGHSERRQHHHENDATVAAKLRAALANGIAPILCVGEGIEIREAGGHVEHCVTQLDAALTGLSAEQVEKVVVAYEPVWAIGTGKTPTTPEVAAAHAHIRKVLGGLTAEAAAMRLLYGGSVNSRNAAELLAAADVDGALVGGASLKADDFLAIAKAA